MSDRKLWDQYVALEKERDELRAELERERKEHSYTQHAAEAEAKQVDRLHAKIEAMEEQEPVFWYRKRSDGAYEGPIHNGSIEETRKQSGVWSPLYSLPGAQSTRDLLLRSRVADLLHLLQFAQIACPTAGDSEQAEVVMADIRRMLEQEAKP